MNTQNGFPVFATVLQANFISKKEDKLSFNTLSDEDVKAIVELSKDEKVATRVSRYSFLKIHVSNCLFEINIFLISIRYLPVLRHRFMAMKT